MKSPASRSLQWDVASGGPALASCFLLASCFTRCPASAPVSSQVQLHCTNATELASKDESIGRMGWARWRCVKSSRSQLPSLALFLSLVPPLWIPQSV